MNGAKKRLQRFIYNSSECDDDTFAFVFPSNADGVPDQEDFFRKNQKEQYVVYAPPPRCFMVFLMP